jgi:hypothetical protein
MSLELTRALGRGAFEAAAPSRLLVEWSRDVERLAGLGSALFLLVFLVIGLVALRRARAQDIPETVRALAQLLYPRTANGTTPHGVDGDRPDQDCP